jgi:hypothetical protein
MRAISASRPALQFGTDASIAIAWFRHETARLNLSESYLSRFVRAGVARSAIENCHSLEELNALMPYVHADSPRPSAGGKYAHHIID